MVDLIQDAADWLSGVMQTKVAIEITYTRGAHTATFDATPAKSEYVREDVETGFQIEMDNRDFIFPISELVLNEAATLPQRGDKITATLNGTSKTFQVYAPGGERLYRFTDPGEKQIRVFTEKVA